MSTTTNLGKVTVVPRGMYSAETQYERLDIVQYNKGSYLVKQSVKGVIPTEGADYTLLAGQGEKGDKGLDGSYVQKAYGTYASMDADKANIPANSSVVVTNDTTANNGMYVYNGTTFTKSAYDPEKIILAKVQNVFNTKDAMTASALTDGSFAQVVNDAVAANNDFYSKAAGVWTKTKYSSVVASREYTDSRVVSLPNIFDNKSNMLQSTLPAHSLAHVIADDAPTNNGYYKRKLDVVDSIITLNNSVSRITDTSKWLKDRATLTTVNPTPEITHAVMTLSGAAKDGLVKHTVYIPAGNQIYYKMRFKVDAGCEYVWIGRSSNGGGGYVEILNPAGDTWVDVSGIRQSPYDSSTAFIVFGYATPEIAAGKKMTIEYHSVIDLTAQLPNGIPDKSILDSATGNKPAPYSVSNSALYPTTDDQKWIKLPETKLPSSNELVIDKNSSINPITDTARWRQQRAKLTVENNQAVLTLDGSAFNGFASHTFYTASEGNDILIKGRVRLEEVGCTSILFGNSGGGGYKEILNPPVGEWIDISAIRKPRTSNDYELLIVPQYASAADAAGKRLIIDYATCIDLTPIFPKGVPTIDTLDTLLGNHAPPYIINFDELAKYTFMISAKEPEKPPSVGIVNPDNVFEVGLDKDNGLDIVKTSHGIELFSQKYPDDAPLKISNYARKPGYAYPERIMNMTTDIYREAYGMQMTMNLNRSNYPTTTMPVKDHKDKNSITTEWGLEGWSIHVCPGGMDYGSRAWMHFKVGGGQARSHLPGKNKHGTKIQHFVPQWIERSEGRPAAGWTESSADATADESVPTITHSRGSKHFRSPEHYYLGYSDAVQGSLWDRYVRHRGRLQDPTPPISGDSIHKQVYSIVTGLDVDGEAIHKDVAQIEIVYMGDGGSDAAKIVFKTWDNDANDWKVKLTL